MEFNPPVSFLLACVSVAAGAPLYLLLKVCPSLLKKAFSVLLGVDVHGPGLTLLLVSESSSFSGLILDPKLMLKLLVSCHTKGREWKLHIQPLPSSFLLKLKLLLAKLQPTKHSVIFWNALFSWPVYFLRIRKFYIIILPQITVLSSGGLKMRWFDGRIISGVRCGTKLPPFLGDLNYAICYWKVKHLFQQWFSHWLCGYTRFFALTFTSSWSFFTFAELLCACVSLVVHWNVQKQCRGTPKPSWLPGKILFHNL